MGARTDSARRAFRIAGLTAGVTGSYVGYLAQSLFLGEQAKQDRKRGAHARVGAKLRTELSALRGPVMKLGQMLSLHTDVLPEEVLRELGTLQMQAPPMHPSLVTATLRSALGKDPDALFKRFDAQPFAAASLGQVHRATLLDGTRVAVKIQYPGIQSAVRDDFRWLRRVSVMAQASGHLPRTLIDEIEAQITAETDYTREAAHLESFARGLRRFVFVHVPQPYPALSGERVLTMSLVPGRHLDAFLARRPSQDTRDLIGHRLMELFYFQVFALRAFHADPHWGNYLFTDTGDIGIVDFGCVKELDANVVNRLRRLYLYTGRRDSPEFQRLLAARYGLPGEKVPAKVLKALTDFSERFYRKVYPPDQKDDVRRFDFSDAVFLRDYVREASRLAHVKGARPEYVFLARAEIGLYTTLHRLKARVATSAIVRAALALKA